MRCFSGPCRRSLRKLAAENFLRGTKILLVMFCIAILGCGICACAGTAASDTTNITQTYSDARKEYHKLTGAWLPEEENIETEIDLISDGDYTSIWIDMQADEEILSSIKSSLTEQLSEPDFETALSTTWFSSTRVGTFKNELFYSPTEQCISLNYFLAD